MIDIGKTVITGHYADYKVSNWYIVFMLLSIVSLIFGFVFSCYFFLMTLITMFIAGIIHFNGEQIDV